MDRVFGVLLPAGARTRCRRRSRRSSTSGRRRASAASSPRADAARKRAGGAGHRPRGHAEGHAVAAEALSGSWRGSASGRARAGRARRWPAATWPAQGFAILARNFRCRVGRDRRRGARRRRHRRSSRSRSGAAALHGEGHEAVTFGKRRRIVRAARLYAAAPRPLRGAAALRRGLDRLGPRDPAAPARAGRLRLERLIGWSRERPWLEERARMKALEGRPRSWRREATPRAALYAARASGAGNGIRTRDFDLGKVALYH